MGAGAKGSNNLLNAVIDETNMITALISQRVASRIVTMTICFRNNRVESRTCEAWVVVLGAHQNA